MITLHSKMKKILKRWLIGCLFFLAACNGKKEEKKDTIILAAERTRFYNRIESVKPLIQNGDLIFRNGTDEVSQAARSMNRVDTSFSHCGLLLVEHDSIFVYHAIGGNYNPSQKLRRDLLDSFLIPGEADRFALYRYPLTRKENDSLTMLVHYYYGRGLRFDMYFNFLSDDKMYCSEFVFKCLNKAMAGSLNHCIAAREWPYGISPDDLFLYEKCQLIKRVDFLQ
jgi:Permuted papain-like amidase enzyme, YaeF/YiiX, C92 family